MALPIGSSAPTVRSYTLRFFGLAEQCPTQKFYLRCFKLDFDAVKSKFGLLIVSNATLRFFSLIEQCHIQKFYFRCFKSDFDAVKSNFSGILYDSTFIGIVKNSKNKIFTRIKSNGKII